jgi:tetratricopeptide (TPR) repeat protein
LNYFIWTILLFTFTSAAYSAEQSWRKWQADGDVDLSQQKLLQAENCYRAALRDIDHQTHTDDELDTCMQKLASTLTLEDKTEAAVVIYQRTLRALEKQYGKDSPRVTPILFALGSIYEAAGDHGLAMNLYRRALAISEKSFGRFSPAAAKSLHYLGRTNFAVGHIDEAERNYKSSLSILVNQPSLASSNELESLLSDYQDLLRKKENTDSTLLSDFEKDILAKHSDVTVSTAPVDVGQSAFQRQISARIEKTQSGSVNEQQQVLLRGYKEPFTGTALAPAYENMSNTLSNQQTFKEQEQHFQKMIAIDIKTLGPTHPTVADDLIGLATLYIAEHRYADAKPLLEKALPIYQNVYGVDNLLVSNTRATLASVYRELGMTDEASNIYSNVFSSAQLALKPNDMETSRILNDLAHLYYRQGKLQDACTVYQWALASTEAAAGKGSPLVAACLTDYANVLSALGRIAEANEAQARALLILAKSPH